MAEVGVRPAVPGDAPGIAHIQVTTWRHAYGSVLPQVVLDALSDELATQAWQAAVGAPPTPAHQVLIAYEKEWTVGFAAVAPPGEGDVESGDPEPETTVVVGPLLVEPRFGRRGHGSRLLAAATDIAREAGSTRAIAWVPEADQVTRDFFASTGWAEDGFARVLDTGAGELREVRLHTSLAP